jgi:hypothetical protein
MAFISTRGISFLYERGGAVSAKALSAEGAVSAKALSAESINRARVFITQDDTLDTSCRMEFYLFC